jgi:hypothetical protein
MKRAVRGHAQQAWDSGGHAGKPVEPWSLKMRFIADLVALYL